MLVIVSLTFIYNRSSSYIEKTFGTENPLPFVALKVNQILKSKTYSQADTDTEKNNSHSFPQNRATVYLDLNDATLQNAAINGLNSWNNTGAFKFNIENNKEKAQIIITTMDDNSTNAAGLTTTEVNSLTGYITKATVKLNTYYLLNPSYGYTNDRIINTVEHELGHAMGLSHTNQVSVMYPQGSFYTIQPKDIADVKKLYNKK